MKNLKKKKSNSRFPKWIFWVAAIILSILFYNPFIPVIWIGIVFIKFGFYFSNGNNRPKESKYDYHQHTNSGY